MDEILQYKHSNENYKIRQYFPVMLFMTLCKVIVTFESVNETIVVQANEKLLPVVQSNPVNTDNEGAIECVRINGGPYIERVLLFKSKTTFLLKK